MALSRNANRIQNKLKTLVDAGTLSLVSLARASGVPLDELKSYSSSDWTPSDETLSSVERFLDSHSETGVLASIEELIEEAQNGRMFILVDDEDRENEGDLVIPAQMATPAAVNFMASHGKGLICLALTRERADALKLAPMAQQNRSRNETAFTTSIEAREGITTGISAADRARTISVAIDNSRSVDEIVSPGHIFPLVARPGGVLIRAGHTEAAVDISRLAGLNASGVICEIMNEDGTMARMDQLVEFAETHDLKIGTIRDLIAYRRNHDRLIKNLSETKFQRHNGKFEWRTLLFYNSATQTENLALVLGDISGNEPTLVRMHHADLFYDCLDIDSERTGLLRRALDAIEAEGAGVVVLVNKVNNMLWRQSVKEQTGESSKEDIEAFRDYGVGAQILAELGVHDMILLTENDQSLVAIQGFDLSIVGKRSL